jgi:quinoprotein relay system zinc metallohydrolase 1
MSKTQPLLNWITAVCLSAASPAVLAQANAQTLSYGLQPREIAPEVWVVEAPVQDFSKTNGCNIINTGFIATKVGTLVINTGVSRLYGEQQRHAITQRSPSPVQQVVNLNLHPDYFFGNQAWADRPLSALAGTIEGQQREGKAYEDNLYRLCGDWMKGSASTPARQPLAPGATSLRLHGHTSDDLVLIDRTAKVMFVGGLVFLNRVPTAPHADIAAWRQSLERLRGLVQEHHIAWIVPSHGTVHADDQGITQTLDWLNWIDTTFSAAAQQGRDLGEVMRARVPDRFKNWAAMPDEYFRTATYLYPRYELRALDQ